MNSNDRNLALLLALERAFRPTWRDAHKGFDVIHRESLDAIRDVRLVEQLNRTPWASTPDRAEGAPLPKRAQQGEAQPARSSRQRGTRVDDMALEIESAVGELRARGETATAARVMALLRARAGRPDSCVTDVAATGVLWRRGSTGIDEKLTMRALNDRLARLRKAR